MYLRLCWRYTCWGDTGRGKSQEMAFIIYNSKLCDEEQIMGHCYGFPVLSVFFICLSRPDVEEVTRSKYT